MPVGSVLPGLLGPTTSTSRQRIYCLDRCRKTAHERRHATSLSSLTVMRGAAGPGRDIVSAVLRPGTDDDLPDLSELERAAGELFRPLGMDLVADDDPPGPADLRPFLDHGRAWVAERGGELAAYLVADVVDGAAHIEQVTVHPRHAHQRLGAALIEHLALWAQQRRLPALTLTAYCDVPWNGPYYLSLGFRWLSDHDVTPGLQALRHHEIGRGLDRWPRGCMRRDIVTKPR